MQQWKDIAMQSTILVSVGMQMISGQVSNTVTVLIERMIAKSAVLVEAMLAVAALRLATSS